MHRNHRSGTGNISLSSSQEVQANLEIKGNITKLPSSFEGLEEPCKAVGAIVRGKMKPSVAYSSVLNEGRGKIDLTGARDQSLRQFFKESTTRKASPTMYVSSVGGSIKMETLSWADNITRKIARDVGHERKWNE